MEVGLVQGKHLSVDGSFVEANAAKESCIPREQLAGAAQANHIVRRYLAEPHLCLHRAPQTLRWVCAKDPMHSGVFRFLAIHMDEPARQRARELAKTPEFAHAQRQRKKVEALFAELKHQIGLSRLRLRRLKFVREQFFLAAAAQNLKRLVRFLSRPTPTVEAAA